MSGREDRDSRGKRLHSTPNVDRSPKRSTDDRPPSERTYSDRDDLNIMNKRRQTKWDQKHPMKLEDTLTLEASSAPEKAKADSVNKEDEKKADASSASTKPFSNQTDVPRSRSYFQTITPVEFLSCWRSVYKTIFFRDEAGFLFGPVRSEPRGWRNGTHREERLNDKAKENPLTSDLQERQESRRKDERHTRYDDKNSWGHDRYHESEVAMRTLRKRPAFRENKLLAKEPEDAPSSAEAAAEPTHEERLISSSARRDERGYLRAQGNPGRTFAGAENIDGSRDGPSWRGEKYGSGYRPRQRFVPDGRGGARGRDRYEGRNWDRNQSRFAAGKQVERWKHDLFDEANRSPTPKNEDDQIAKIEALLAL
ncbi:hypothetical protein Taro_055428 [Colocasia esculenta]|uniref:Btz domain-containing protein n=1 Tax=Colocasia esculenta TaxID=4460 RepID=A0A843XU77_COLES|nr:hypothetical protein [Colocasia esculenta]